ncbi:hypothetical protein AHAS_Ahas19G0104300 [Arachis hypogaea]
MDVIERAEKRRGPAAERATPDVGVPMRPTRIHDDACSLGFRSFCFNVVTLMY